MVVYQHCPMTEWLPFIPKANTKAPKDFYLNACVARYLRSVMAECVSVFISEEIKGLT